MTEFDCLKRLNLTEFRLVANSVTETGEITKPLVESFSTEFDCLKRLNLTEFATSRDWLDIQSVWSRIEST